MEGHPSDSNHREKAKETGAEETRGYSASIRSTEAENTRKKGRSEVVGMIDGSA